MKLCVTIRLLSIALLIEAEKMAANETGNKRVYRRGKSARATWHSGVCLVGKSTAATKLSEQSVLINSEQRTRMVDY